jgi:fatty-acyl-CoA synthase
MIVNASPRRLYPRAYERPGLLDWLEQPRAGHGLHFADEDGSGWTFWEYPRLAAIVASAAEQIAELRHRPTGVVSIVTRTGPEFVAAFQGALAAGNTPSPIALPLFARNRQMYLDHVAAILDTAQPTLIVADEGVVDIVAEAAALAGIEHPPQTLRLEESQAPPNVAPQAELALLQCTSGSSGRPRGVRVTWRNLESNIAMIRDWLRMTPEDQTATWLPLFHDMGLIGCLLTPIVNQTDVWIMRPDQFVADPARWIDVFGSRGVEIGVAPNFGFAYAARRVPDEALHRMDFSRWRVAIVGAERLDPAALGGFATRLAPYGFRASAFLPAYGLAEATLAVTGLSLDEVPRAVRPEWESVVTGQRLVISDEASLESTARIGEGDGWVLGCGRPLPGVEVTIVDEDGRSLPEGHLGEIAVSGPTVADGYETEAVGASTRFSRDRVETGDAGFVLNGELFVLGRLGDAVKARGRTVFVEDVESRLATVEGVQKGRCVALAGSAPDGERLVAIVESEAGPWVDEVGAILRTQVGRDAAVQVFAGPPGTIERTSSGKPRRRVMWQALLAGAFEAELVYDGPRGGAGAR